jgi:hypothetical protein
MRSLDDVPSEARREVRAKPNRGLLGAFFGYANTASLFYTGDAATDSTPRRSASSGSGNAVQQPIGTLDLSKLSVTREFGRSFATLHDALEVHTQSTGKIAVEAEWTENVDLLGEPGPVG